MPETECRHSPALLSQGLELSSRYSRQKLPSTLMRGTLSYLKISSVVSMGGSCTGVINIALMLHMKAMDKKLAMTVHISSKPLPTKPVVKKVLCSDFFFLFSEPSRQWLSIQRSEGEKDDEANIQGSHSVTLTDLGSYSAGDTDREERNSNHDPAVIIKGSDNVRGRGKFPGRFRNPAHGVHTNTRGIIHL